MGSLWINPAQNCGFAVNSHRLSAVGSQFRLAALSLFRRSNFHGLLTTIIIIHFHFLWLEVERTGLGSSGSGISEAEQTWCSLIHRLLPSAVTFCSSSQSPSL